jgi:hypothetical protein
VEQLSRIRKNAGFSQDIFSRIAEWGRNYEGWPVSVLHMAVKGCRRPALTHASETHPPQLWRPSDRGESQTRTFCGIASNKAKPKILPLQFEVYIIVFLVPLRGIIFIGIMFGGLHLYIASISPRRAWFNIGGSCSIYDGQRRTGTDCSSFAV